MSILLLTNKEDVAADLVVRELRIRDAAFLRFNVEDASMAAVELDPATGDWSWLLNDGREYTSKHGFRSIWYRRPGWIGEGVLRADIAEFVNNQWRQFLWSLTSAEDTFWMNDPYLNLKAECKPIQLKIARQVGLSIPETRITNSSRCLAQFRANNLGGTIVKALYSPLLETDQSFIFTHLLENSEVPNEIEMAISPLICQRALYPKRDLRVTIVGKYIYTAELITTVSDPIDWRLMAHEGNWQPTELPMQLCDSLFEFVNRLGLSFAAIDLIYRNEEYYFIEVNPNGEWAWLQTQARLPIARAIADTLINGK